MQKRPLFVIAAVLLLAVSFANAIEIDKAGDNRSFLLSNGNGTYFYGSTGDQWDEGWMGLWVNRERVAGPVRILDENDEERLFSGAKFTGSVYEITWTWPDNKSLCLFFDGVNDTLHYLCSKGWKLKEFTGWIVSPEVIKLNGHDVFFLDDLLLIDDDKVSWTVVVAEDHLLNLLAENDSLLYAGIPWFNEGWGRDTFISLPGLLVTGHYDVARKLLMRFAGWIDRDPNSPTYGRIPNRVRPGEDIAYNTADGTPWWMREVYEYGIYSGDYSLWDELLSDSGAMRIALDAAVLRSDSLGFLTHGDADTWMDAVGPQGAHTPRGNRAVEIQALHYASLDNATRMTKNANPKWRETADKLRRNFLATYLAPTQDYLYDRIEPSGRPDTTMRPNQMFAFTVPYTQLLPPQLESAVTKKIAGELFYEHGVLSLSPQDTCFHPFHMDWHYPKDNAYHQGVVWVWNSGPAKSLLIRQGRGDLALKMMEYEAWHMRERGMVGSLPELFDAVKRPENEYINWSGTASQAWSLAEFLRATYQDFLGIRPVLFGRVDPFWFFAPRIPESWGQVQTTVNCSGTPINVTMQQFPDSTVIELQAQTTPKYPLPVKFFDVARGISGQINTTDLLRVVYRKKDGYMLADGQPTAQHKLTGWPYDKGPQDLKFAPPIKKLDFASLQDPEWEILTGKDILCDIETSLLLSRTADSLGDDHGGGAYVYPSDENFKPGILDLKQFEVRETSDSYYFELQTAALHQPGWHPEYGFQLTFAAICLHSTGAQRTTVGANANEQLTTPFSRVIYIGGGMRMEDEQGHVIAEFIPRSNADAFGDLNSSTISFCLPKSLFPKNDDRWQWTVLCGAQDDHGGAGIGEFRTVKPVVERWAGGGNLYNRTNIYDRLTTVGQ